MTEIRSGSLSVMGARVPARHPGHHLHQCHHPVRHRAPPQSRPRLRLRPLRWPKSSRLMLGPNPAGLWPAPATFDKASSPGNKAVVDADALRFLCSGSEAGCEMTTAAFNRGKQWAFDVHGADSTGATLRTVTVRVHASAALELGVDESYRVSNYANRRSPRPSCSVLADGALTLPSSLPCLHIAHRQRHARGHRCTNSVGRHVRIGEPVSIGNH